jgi:hypothetical protein
VKRWSAFNAICCELRAGLLNDHSRSVFPCPPWEAVVEVSNEHAVTAAVACCYLKNKTFLPPNVHGYFDGILKLNSIRNQRMIDGLARVVAALNASDIEPILLKGAAHLVDNLYPSLGMRVVRDIDLLVTDARAKDAVAALLKIGFVDTGPLPEPHAHHHLRGLREERTGLYVELHTRVDHKESVASTAWFREEARAVPFRGLKVFLPEATRNIAHNIVHSQLNDNHYVKSRIELRQLLDVVLIRARHQDDIDWSGLDHHFCNAGFGHVLATYLRFCEVFFGQSAPPLRSQPRPTSVNRFRVVLERSERQQRAKQRLGRPLQQQIALLQHLLAEREQQLANILKSTSWRVTTPLRLAGDFLRSKGVRRAFKWPRSQEYHQSR